jgi:hypothetical protein
MPKRASGSRQTSPAEAPQRSPPCLWELFSAAFPNPPSGRFNLFLGSGAPSAQRASTAEPLLTFSTSTLTHPLHLPPSSERPILAPQALSPKWTPLHLPCASWLAVYIGLCYQLAFALASLIHRRPLSSGVYSVFSRTHASSHERTTIGTPPCPSSSTLDRTRAP